MGLCEEQSGSLGWKPSHEKEDGGLKTCSLSVSDFLNFLILEEVNSGETTFITKPGILTCQYYVSLQNSL